MDTSKHTVTLPINDYHEIVSKAIEYEKQSDVLSYIEGVIKSETDSELIKYYRIRAAMNSWCPEHDLEEDHY